MKIKLIAAALGMVMLSACSESDFNLETFDSTPYEADIKFVVLDDASILKSEADTLHDASKFVVEDQIEIALNRKADMTKIAPRFILTDGSAIYMQNEETGKWNVPANGVERDFSEGGLQYMVVSKNRQSHHLYELVFNCSEIPDLYRLDWSELNDPTGLPHYYVFKEYDEGGNYVLTWCTANPGFGVSKSKADAMDYPTIPCEGWNGNGQGVALRTMLTGSIASMMHMPIAAGNLFLGDFNTVTALKQPLASTRFGISYNKKPMQLCGYMNYQPGDVYTDSLLNVVDNVADSCSIYAVLYRNVDNNGNAVVLDGNTIESSPYIVARAELLDSRRAGTNGKWSYFCVDFDYDSYMLKFDEKIAAANGYNITVVSSSSNMGAHFRGAVGSTLKVDELEVVGEEINIEE